MHNYLKTTLSLSPVMPVLTINTLDKIEYLFDALIEGNIKVVEITLRTKNGLGSIYLSQDWYSEQNGGIKRSAALTAS